MESFSTHSSTAAVSVVLIGPALQLLYRWGSDWSSSTAAVLVVLIGPALQLQYLWF